MNQGFARKENCRSCDILEIMFLQKKVIWEKTLGLSYELIDRVQVGDLQFLW